MAATRQSSGADPSPLVPEAQQALLNHISSLSKALARARSAGEALPSEEDYHFYKLFPDFKQPIDAAGERIKQLLLRFGGAADWADEPEEASEWLVGILDDLLEQVDKSLDAAERGDPSGSTAGPASKPAAGASVVSHVIGKNWRQSPSLNMAAMSKPQEQFTEAIDNANVPFQPKGPFLLYKGGEDNAAGVHPEDWAAFISGRAHVDGAGNGATGEVSTLQRGEKSSSENSGATGRSKGLPVKLSIDTELGSRPASPRPASPSRGLLALDMHAKRLGIRSAKRGRTHPLEKTLKELSYPPWQFQPPPDPLVEPESIDARQIDLVDSLSELQSVAEKLAVEREVACDLEAHQYRSFQGFVCLMQLSTRTDDFVIDTIALRDHIGPTLGPIFADSSILKVLHGADRDILWLQRDFGLYVVNMFDTGQAARQLSLASFGLGYLLQHFCGVHTDKRYQLADWRIRPLPEEMFKYARMDTHYLLYIYDHLRGLLLRHGLKRKRKEGDSGDEQEALRTDLVQQVLDRSRDLCLQLYEKELFHERSYLKLYKKHDRQMNKQQLAALAGLYAWRDRTAREQDESCGYILPKHLLIRLAEELPSNVRKLQSLVRGQSAVVIQRAADVIEVVRAAKEQASGAGGAAFDSVTWEGADVIPDFGTSEDEGSSEVWEGLARDGLESDGDVESGAAVQTDLPDSPNSGLESLHKRVLGQSSLGDPAKSAVGPTLASTTEAPASNGQVSVPFELPRGMQGGVVIKRATGSAMFGRPGKKANSGLGNQSRGDTQAEKARTVDEPAVQIPAAQVMAGGEESGVSMWQTDGAAPLCAMGDTRASGLKCDAGPSSSTVERGKGHDAPDAGGEVSGKMEGVSNDRVVIAEKGPDRKKRKGGLANMFGSRASREASNDSIAKAAAERIRKSLALPFTPSGAAVSSARKVKENQIHPPQPDFDEERSLASGAAVQTTVIEARDSPAIFGETMDLEEGEEEGSGQEEAAPTPDPEEEKRALFGTQDLPKPISQAYRNEGRGPGEKIESRGEKRRQQDEAASKESEVEKVREKLGDASEIKRGERQKLSSSRPDVSIETLSKDGEFDFASAAGALGLHSVLGMHRGSSKRDDGKKGRGGKPNRGSKPEEERYGSQKEEQADPFSPFASMEEDGPGIKAGKRSQAFPRSGNRMFTFRRD